MNTHPRPARIPGHSARTRRKGARIGRRARSVPAQGGRIDTRPVWVRKSVRRGSPPSRRPAHHPRRVCANSRPKRQGWVPTDWNSMTVGGCAAGGGQAARTYRPGSRSDRQGMEATPPGPEMVVRGPRRPARVMGGLSRNSSELWKTRPKGEQTTGRASRSAPCGDIGEPEVAWLLCSDWPLSTLQEEAVRPGLVYSVDEGTSATSSARAVPRRQHGEAPDLVECPVRVKVGPASSRSRPSSRGRRCSGPSPRSSRGRGGSTACRRS